MNALLLTCLLLGGTALDPTAVLTRYEVKPGSDKQFRLAIARYVTQANADRDNVMAEAYYEQDKPSVFWTIERWNNKKLPGNVVNDSLLAQPVKRIYIKDLEPLSKTEWRRKPGKDDQPITIMLFVDCKPGTENNFKDVYHTAMPLFRSEAGVINYQLSQLEDDKTQFVTYEKFRNEEAFQYHLKFPPIQPVIDYLNSSIKQQPFQTGLHRLVMFTSTNSN